jgi:hypothetical protein
LIGDFEDKTEGELIGGDIGPADLILDESSNPDVGLGDGLDFREGDLIGVSGLDFKSGFDGWDFTGVSGPFSRLIGDNGRGESGSGLLFRS